MEAASLNISHRHDMRTRWKDIFHTVDMCSWCIRLVWFNMIQDHLILFNLIHFCSIRYSILLRRIQHDLIFFNTIQHHSMSISFNISFFLKCHPILFNMNTLLWHTQIIKMALFLSTTHKQLLNLLATLSPFWRFLLCSARSAHPMYMVPRQWTSASFSASVLSTNCRFPFLVEQKNIDKNKKTSESQHL